MMLRQILLLGLALWLPILVQAQRPTRSHPQQQMSFGVEMTVKHPINLPADVLQMLRSDEDVQRVCSGQGVASDHIQAASFAASHVDLSNKRSPDLIVTAAENKSCYVGGANIDPFWIFYSTPAGYKLALKVNTMSLELRKTRTKGYRDIEIAKAVGGKVFTTIFKFDGSQYKEWRSWKSPVKF